MDVIIKANKISYSYNSKSNVLEDINFEVYKNDFVALIGPNGGGKSTLLKIILGLLVPSVGEIKVFNQAPKNIRDAIAYVPQYSQIDLDYPISVFEVVASALLGRKRIASRFNKQEKEIVKNTLRDMKLLDLADRAIGQLSGGQRQRVLLARALVRRPQLLILDEPTNNVDLASGSDLYELLHHLNQQGMSIIVVSHDVSVVSKYVNRVFCLNKKIICNQADKITGHCDFDDFLHVHHSQECIIH